MRKLSCIIGGMIDEKALDNSEAGYILIAVLVLAAMILIALAVAAPQVSVDLQRDKEGELFHRGMQYAGAIRRYYRRFGAYPNSLDQLDKTNNIRFLRRRYKDPITGKDDWRLIRFGQATTTGTGMFGQPAPTVGGGSATGTSGTSGSSFGNSGSSFGSSGGSSFGGGSSFSSGSSFGDTGSSGTPGSGTSGSGSSANGNSTDPGTNPGGGGASSSGSTPIGGGSGSTFGGGGIIGVSSTSPKQSIREYKKQTHYNQWEFLYDPNQDNRTPGSTGTGVGTTPGGTQSNSPFGNQSSGSSGGNGGGFGPQPTSPNTPTAPPTQ